MDATGLGRLDAVLISHGHYDHLDVASLRKLDASVPVVVPRGLGRLLRRAGLKDVAEADVGDQFVFGEISVRATPAKHSTGGHIRKSEALGFAIEGSRSVYFAGDTDLFEGMAELAPVDLALVPVWGWGPSLGEGHLDPIRAATAAFVLGARTAIPIHWGTYYPLHRRKGDFLTEPPLAFARAAREVAPQTRVEVLAVGETRSLDPA